MSEKLGTCDKWGEPHERVVIFAPQLDLDIENHYCNWQPLPTPSETPSEPPTDQLVRVIESLFHRSERERLWRDNLSDEQTHSKSFSDGMICGLAIATGELTPLAESLTRVLATPPTDETPTSEGEKE